MCACIAYICELLFFLQLIITNYVMHEIFGVNKIVNVCSSDFIIVYASCKMQMETFVAFKQINKNKRRLILLFLQYQF